MELLQVNKYRFMDMTIQLLKRRFSLLSMKHLSRRQLYSVVVPGTLHHVMMLQLADMTRISQRDIYPTAVKNRGLGNVVKVFETLQGSVTLSNGDDATFSLRFINELDADLLVEPEWSLWQTSISSANLIPNGASIDMSDYQIMGPWNEWTEVIFNEGDVEEPIPTFASVSRMYVRNISAGASTVIIARARLRYITNLLQVSLS